MQAWGAASRFARRDTNQEPTKSGVIGILAAAQGRRRKDPIEDLACLSFGVRTDQPGRLIRDFQVAIRPTDGRSMPLSYRYYLSDAVFVAAVNGPSDLIDGLLEALRNPTFPLYLGRRSCPPSRPLIMSPSTTEASVLDALREVPWQAARWYQRRQPTTVSLRIRFDADAPRDGDVVRDQPVSFDPELRQYDWRSVSEASCIIDNSVGRPWHDPMAALGG